MHIFLTLGVLTLVRMFSGTYSLSIYKFHREISFFVLLDFYIIMLNVGKSGDLVDHWQGLGGRGRKCFAEVEAPVMLKSFPTLAIDDRGRQHVVGESI